MKTLFLVYLEADVDNCNHLHFHLADLAEATASIANPHGLKALATRTWDITVQLQIII